MRLIDANALKDRLKKLLKTEPSSIYGCGLRLAIEEIDNAPTVDIWQMRQEATENAIKKAEVLYGRPQGEWINLDLNDKFKIGVYKCNLCGYNYPVPDELSKNFCPKCGADMRKGGAV